MYTYIMVAIQQPVNSDGEFKMARKNSKHQIADVTRELLVDDGFYQNEDGTWQDMREGVMSSELLTFEEVSRRYAEAHKPKTSTPKAEAVKVPQSVIQTTRRIAQYYSTDAEILGEWGDHEVSFKSVVNGVIMAYASKTGGTSEGQTVDAKMVKNAIATLKRQGEIRGTRRGWFLASPTAKVDFAIFVPDDAPIAF